jgi:hypothetical protein
LRQNPRRSSSTSTTRTGCPPALLRQSDRKVNFVDSLVDTSTQIVEAIWPLSSIFCRNELGSRAQLPLRTFIQETLRRSRTSYSTLQVALYYLVLIKPHVPKHDFTMEQPEDSLACRFLQCGRRMFLAALILASKYLQDRNYSAKAWSRISGLNTQEINQNEISFLIAVDWKLHITDDVFERWTDIVINHTPPAPPSPGNVCPIYARKCQDWKQLVLKLTPELDNVEDLVPATPKTARIENRDLVAVSPTGVFGTSSSPCGYGYDSAELTPTPKPKAFIRPVAMEPSPATVHTPGRGAPALGLLPTPRLTPQSSACNTPAVSAASYLLGKPCAMGMAIAHASSTCTQNVDRWPLSMTSSPMAYFPPRRSSLANSVSTASSPESMVSDSSRISRSSSISSASSTAISAAPHLLGVPARFRHGKLSVERASLRTAIASVPEDYEDTCMTASPESYTGPVGKLGEMSLETPLGQRERELEEMAQDPASEAARALQELQNYRLSTCSTATVRAGLKRSRTFSVDQSSLHDNVREMLGGSIRPSVSNPAWPDTMVRRRLVSTRSSEQFPSCSSLAVGQKRVCCSTEASEGFEVVGTHPAMGSFRGPGMWEGILN